MEGAREGFGVSRWLAPRGQSQEGKGRHCMFEELNNTQKCQFLK